MVDFLMSNAVELVALCVQLGTLTIFILLLNFFILQFKQVLYGPMHNPLRGGSNMNCVISILQFPEPQYEVNELTTGDGHVPLHNQAAL